MENTENKIRINTFTVNNNEAVSISYVLTDKNTYIKYISINGQIISDSIYEVTSTNVVINEFVRAANKRKLDLESISIVDSDTAAVDRESAITILNTLARRKFRGSATNDDCHHLALVRTDDNELAWYLKYTIVEGV